MYGHLYFDKTLENFRLFGMILDIVEPFMTNIIIHCINTQEAVCDNNTINQVVNYCWNMQGKE